MRHGTKTILVAAGIGLCSAATTAAAPGYKHYVVGNAADVTTVTTPLLVMQGGGTDVDANFVRMGAAAGGGDFVVIRASGTDAYNPYILDLCGCDSVETFVFKNRNGAYQPFVIDHIRNAEALFIAGGDQSKYVDFWKGTPVEDAINYLANVKKVPIGGTSAGMAVLGEFLYSAMSNKSLTSPVALANPFDNDVTLDREFLTIPTQAGIITDQHLIERDRMGRTVTFLARLIKDGWTQQGLAIAADRETAVHVDPQTGKATIFATPTHPTPYAYFLRTPGPPEICQPRVPLTFHNVQVYRVDPSGWFDLTTWTGHEGIAYTLSADAGVLTSSNGSIY